MGRWQTAKKFFRDNFFSGLLIVIPAVASLYVLVNILQWLYEKLVVLPLLSYWLSPILEEVLPNWAIPSVTRSIHVVEFLAVVTLLFTGISFVGLGAKLRLVNWFINLAERTLRSIPLIGTVYSALQQLMTALFSGKGSFTRVVLVQFPREGLWSVGFLSRELDAKVAGQLGLGRLMSVFVPTTPNPTTGFLVMLPEDQIVQVDMSIEEAFKLIMSGGMAQPREPLQSPLEKLRRPGSSDCASENPGS